MLGKKFGLLATVVASVLTLGACAGESSSSASSAGDKKEIVIGFGVGNYVDQVTEGIAPIMAKKGYTIVPRVFSQNRQINPAFEEDAIDASVNQSRAYMQAYNEKNQLDMVVLTDSPSAPQSLRSIKHRSVDDVKDGMIVAIPNDPVNAERAAKLLADLGWVQLKPNTNALTFSVNDILPGKYTLDIRETDAAQGLRLLEDVDYAVINGNYIASAGQRIADGLMVEQSPLVHRVMVTVRDKNSNTAWAQDLKAAFESKEYADFIRSKRIYDGFILPEAWPQ